MRRRCAATAVYTVDFGPAPKVEPEPQGRVPRVTKMLALAHRIDRMVHDEQLRDYAHAAEVTGLTRARITQVTSLLLLAPEIQEAIAGLPLIYEGRDPISERQLRPVAAEVDWQAQLRLWRRFCLVGD